MSNYNLQDAIKFTYKLHGPPHKFKISPFSERTNDFFYFMENKVDIDLPFVNTCGISLSKFRKLSSLEKLSFIFFICYGIHKTRIHFDGDTNLGTAKPILSSRRVIASGGASYPTEIYIILNNQINNFNNSHYYAFKYLPNFHALMLINNTSKNLLLNLKNRDKHNYIQIYLTVKFEKSARKYKSFAYRLTAVDTGLVIRRITAILESLKIRYLIDFDFDSKTAEKNLNLTSPYEGVYAIITIENFLENFIKLEHIISASRRFKFSFNPYSLPDDLKLMHTFCNKYIYNKKLFHKKINDYYQTSYSIKKLVKAIDKRTSKAEDFIGLPSHKMSLFKILNYAIKSLHFINKHCAFNNNPINLKLYCAVLNVTHIDSGLYSYDGKKIILLNKGNFRKSLTDSLHIQSVNIGLSAFIIHIVGELNWQNSMRGPKNYRIQQMLVGCALEAITLAANIYNLSAHAYLGYDSEKIKSLYNSFSKNEFILAQICLGVSKDSDKIESIIVF